METLQHMILHDISNSEEIEAVKSGAHTLTYAEYRKRINQLAQALLDKGIKKATEWRCFAKTATRHPLSCLRHSKSARLLCRSAGN